MTRAVLDVSIVCYQPKQSAVVLSNPAVLVEILSYRTMYIDRREKLINYRRLTSLRNYLIVSQHDPWVEHHWRDAANNWQLETLEHGGALHIACLNLSLPMALIYEDLSPPVRLGSFPLTSAS